VISPFGIRKLTGCNSGGERIREGDARNVEQQPQDNVTEGDYMKTTNTATLVAAFLLTLSVSATCYAASRSLNDVQMRAAPKDNPGVKTVRGYLEEVELKDSDGKPITGETKKAMMKLFGHHGVKESTVWMDANGVGTWEAPSAIADDGSFTEDTVITGLNENKGRSEERTAGQLPAKSREVAVPTNPPGVEKGTVSTSLVDTNAAQQNVALPIVISFETAPSQAAKLADAPPLQYKKAKGTTIDEVEVVLEYMVKGVNGYGNAVKAANAAKIQTPR
jgi:hypothetical protein